MTLAACNWCSVTGNEIKKEIQAIRLALRNFMTDSLLHHPDKSFAGEQPVDATRGSWLRQARQCAAFSLLSAILTINNRPRNKQKAAVMAYPSGLRTR